MSEYKSQEQLSRAFPSGQEVKFGSNTAIVQDVIHCEDGENIVYITLNGDQYPADPKSLEPIFA